MSPAATLALYGDHLPSFASAFAKLGLRDHRSDYLIWRPGLAASSPAPREDLAAHALGETVLRAHFPAGRSAVETSRQAGAVAR